MDWEYIARLKADFPDTTVVQPSCGARCVYTVLKMFGKESPPIEALEVSLDTDTETCESSLADMKGHLESLGLHTFATRSKLEDIDSSFSKYVSVVHTQLESPHAPDSIVDHFVVIIKSKNDSYYVLDPPFHRTYRLDTKTSLQEMSSEIGYAESALVVSDSLITVNRPYAASPGTALLVAVILFLWASIGFLGARFGHVLRSLFRTRALPMVAAGLLFASGALAEGALQMPEKVDAGALPRAEFAKVEFSYKNNSEKTVGITRTSRSCGCSDVEITEKILKPGETGMCSVRIASGDYAPNTISITLWTDEEEGASYTTKLSYRFHHPFVLQPAAVFVSKKEGQSTSRSLRISARNGYGEYISSLSIRSISPEGLEANIAHESQGATVTVNVPAALSGRTKGELVITAGKSDEEIATYTVPVLITCESPIQFCPRKLIVLERKRSDSGGTVTTFKIRGAKPFKVESVQAVPDCLALEWDRLELATEHVVRCNVGCPDMDGLVRDGIVKGEVSAKVSGYETHFVLPFIFVRSE